MKRTKTPKRHIVSDLHFLLAVARRFSCRVVLFAVLVAVLTVAVSTTEWLLLPLIMRQVETSASLITLLTVIAAAALMLGVWRLLLRCADNAFDESRDAFRTRGCTSLVKRALTLSYPQATDVQSVKRLESAASAMGKHIHAPMAHIWRTMSTLLVNTLQIVVFGGALCVLPLTVILTTGAAAVLRALVHCAVSRYGERDREEECRHDARLAYAVRTASNEAMSEDIHVFGLATWLMHIHDSGLRAVRAFIEKRAKVYVLYNVADALLTLATNGIAYAVLIGMTVDGAMPLSLFVLCFFAVSGFSHSVSRWFADMAVLKQETDALSVYREYLEQDDTFLTDGGIVPERGKSHTLELRGVTFRYPSSEKAVLSHVDVTLRAGEKLAVVGGDGAGKTALARLLCGLYDPDEGEVLLDGVNVKACDRRAYYALFSTVFEDSTLPDMTIADTVAGGEQELDKDRLWRCMEQAGIADTVRELPRGIDTPIGHTAYRDGVELSGGQAQRVLLARALYKNGDILILDEPATALDPLAERALYREYDRMTTGKSAVFISRRLASTRFCDRILFLKNGAIVEEGTHESLMKQNGEYARLYELQSRYYREGRELPR